MNGSALLAAQRVRSKGLSRTPAIGRTVGFTAALLVASQACAAPLSPNAGSFSGDGALKDHDGNSGVWRASGALKDGDFSGALTATLGGKALTVTLQPGPAYFENGFCVLKENPAATAWSCAGNATAPPSVPER